MTEHNVSTGTGAAAQRLQEGQRSRSAPCSEALPSGVILTAVAISSSSYLVALHTMARRPAAGAAPARRLAVDCFMVRAIVVDWLRYGWMGCPCEAKVAVQVLAAPIECAAERRTPLKALIRPSPVWRRKVTGKHQRGSSRERE